MNESLDREEERRERSLHALGRAMRGDGEPAPAPRSLLAMVEEDGRDDERQDARQRHGRARALREEAALAENPASALPQWSEFEQRDWRPEPLPSVADDYDSDWDSTWESPAPDREDRTVARHGSWRRVVSTTVAGALLGAAVAFSLPTRYQATAELTLDGGGAPALASGVIDSQLRVLTSGIVLTKVVDRLNLAKDPDFNGKGGGGGLAGLVRAVLLRDGSGIDEGRRQAFAVDRLAATLSVARGNAANVIDVTATTANGEKSALIANAVAGTFVGVYQQNRSGAASGPADGAASDQNAALAARRQLDDFARRHDLGELAKQPERIAEILNLQDDLATARARTEALNAKVAALRSVGVDSVSGGLPREFETGAVQALRMQYLDLKQKVDRAAVKLGPRNPERRGLEAQLDGARARLSAELRRIAAVQRDRLKQAVEKEQALAARFAKTGLSGEDVAALRDIKREIAAAEVDRTTTASIPGGAAASGRGAHVVSQAVAPANPSGPPKAMLTLGGALLGLFAGLGLGVLRGNGGRTADSEAAGPGLLSTGAIRLAGRNSPDRPNLPPADEWDEQTGLNEEHYQSDAASAWRGFDVPSPDEPRQAHRPLDHDDFTDFAATTDSMETRMYPVYSDQPYALAPQQPQAPSHHGAPAYAPPAQAMPAHAPAGYPPQVYPPQQMMQPLPPYPPQTWQPVPAYPYPQQPQSYAGQYYPPQPAFAQPAFAPPVQDAWPQPAIDQDALDEIRASLHEFREALRDLAENRPRRRILGA
jgi:uncharacterized protein involved in exopolysaccharide biosynthesis